MASEKVKFWPFRGTKAVVMSQEPFDGKIYFTTDTNEIYLDIGHTRHLMGGTGGSGSGSGIIYADGTEEQIIKVSENIDDFNYKISMSALENSILEPQKDALILNSDGRFFRVLSVDSINQIIDAVLLAISGTGGGVIQEPDISISVDEDTLKTGDILIYGQKHNVDVTVYAQTSGSVSLDFKFVSSDGQYEETFSKIATSGEKFSFDLSVLPVTEGNTTMTMTVTAIADNSNMPKGVSWSISRIKIVEMGIQKMSNATYIPVVDEENNWILSLSYKPIGDNTLTENYLHVYVDGAEISDKSRTYQIPSSAFNDENHISIGKQTHGSHVIELGISTVINDTEIFSDTIKFEAAWADADNDTPIIWTGDYNDVVINYETASIPFMVYNPVDVRDGRASKILLFKNGLQISEIQVPYSKTDWYYWDISAIYELGDNLLAIQQDITSKEISIYITEEGSRDLEIKPKDFLRLNFSTAGRSNSELKSQRPLWKSTGIFDTQAQLSGFNWANNGWVTPIPGSADYNSGAYLTLANGANVRIPMGTWAVNSDRDISFEFRFRVRNIQKYSTLVTSEAKYFYELHDPETNTWIRQSDSKSMRDIIANPNMRVVYDQYGSPDEDEENTEDTINISNGVICSWLNDEIDKYGFAIGTQEAFFNSSKKTVRVRYKDDQILNLSFVISKTDHTIYIYLNGVPAGAAALPVDANKNPVGWVTSQDLIFNSDYCDIDLFRIRVFNYGLSTPQVIHNYLADRHDIKLYDQNKLTVGGKDNLLDYNLLTKYNLEHPNDLTMPYATWKITGGTDEILPYKKGNNRLCDVNFVNPSLDKALDDGDITPWFYYTHSPSFFASGVDINVQGTSSQEYPRRNFKTKYKGSDWRFTHGPLIGEKVDVDHYFTLENEWIGAELEAQGETESKDEYKNRMKAYKKLVKKFHMDTESVSTNKFTWKIDYMESSGTYNTGLANLMGNLQYPLYNKHPLEDLGLDATDMRTTVYGYPVLTFHEFADGTYEYIGRYNMNLDKSSNEYYGFEIESAHPYVPGKTIAEVAECWEMKDNQGTWCSLKFPGEEQRLIGFDSRRGKLEGEDADPVEYTKLEMSRHYEVRYNYCADQIEAILGELLAYNDTVSSKFTPEVGENRTAHNHYLREKFYNLERLIYWLDSTDQSSVTNDSIVIYEPIKNNETGDVTIQRTEKESVDFITANDYTGSLGASSVAVTGGYRTTFTLDTIEYRKEKFKSELSKHLDLHYCLVYFIITELLLCFDSRGKNMMLGTFGPLEEDGEYIWYPMFYDIDTQLGLNNSGSYLWDYDAEVTEDGIFSTATSVLWNNLWDCFYGDIITEYRILRGQSSDDKNKGNLTYQNIVGAYECNPTVFNSYAMKGNRPIIAIGLDEYYKYFATTTASGIGYYTTNGVLTFEATPGYAYCCQGDKILSTELLLRNRLNYIDSKWLAGDYAEASLQNSSITARSTLNNRNTSDIYLNLTEEQIAGDSQYNGYQHGDFPVRYFDAIPGFKIKPFLKQYVTYYTDQIAAQPVKYSDTPAEADGVWTNVNTEMQIAYKEKVGLQDQIFKIPGVDFISSLGDLSTTYLTRFWVQGGRRLLDLKIGSDVPGYKHLRYDSTQVNFFAAVDDSQNKPLLKQIILSNIGSLNGGVNFSGSGKLNEFRALGTNLSDVVFAPGAPLSIVHLPKTIANFVIEEASNLTKLITTTPIVGDYDSDNNIFTYRDSSQYEGLYIEGVTDLDINNIPKINNKPIGHALNRLSIKGGNLGYNSYILLRNLVALKDGADSANKLGINLENIHWTPYDLVEYGEPQKDGPYYQLTDHSVYIPYNGTSEEDWRNLTLNEKIYTKNVEADENTITSLALLDIFRADYDNAVQINNFTNLNVSTTKMHPYLSGDMYINNPASDPIDEADLTNIYGSIWEDLVIRVANIKESYLAKYIQVLDSGKEDEIEVIRYSSELDSPQVTLTSKNPSKQYYDFKGWSLTKGSSRADFATYDKETKICTIINPQTFSSERTTILLYAVFENHPHDVNFYDYNGDYLTTTYSTYGTPVKDPNLLPSTNESALNLDETYRFKGWSREPINPNTVTDKIIKDNVVTLENTLVTRDHINFYAVYKKQSVYDETTDLKYFDFTRINRYEDTDWIRANIGGSSDYNLPKENSEDSAGWEIGIKPDASIQGKITLPSYYNGKPIISINSTFSDRNENNLIGRGKNITHIFWKTSSTEPCELRILNSYCFAGDNITDRTHLKYLELPNTVRYIAGSAFFFCQITTITPEIGPNSVPEENSIILPADLAFIDNSAFNRAFGAKTPINRLVLPSKLAKIGTRAFTNIESNILSLEIGSESQGSSLTYLATDNSDVNFITTDISSGQYYVHAENQTNAITIWCKSSLQSQGFDKLINNKIINPNNDQCTVSIGNAEDAMS